MKTYKLEWPTVVVASVGMVCTLLALTLSPEDVRTEIAGPIAVFAIAAAGAMDRMLKQDPR